MPRLATRFSLGGVLLATALAAQAGAQDRTADVLAQARDAIGLRPPLTLTSLAVTATVRRRSPIASTEFTTEARLEWLLPGRYRRTERPSPRPGAMSLEITHGVSGDDLFFDGGGPAAGIDPTAPGPRRDEMLKQLKLEMAQLLTTWTLSPPDSQTYTVADAGVAENPGGKADALDFKGPDGFNLRVFLDTSTHRLVLATYEIQTVALDRAQMQALQETFTKRIQDNPQQRGEIEREMQDVIAKLPKSAATVIVNVSDFRPEGGLSVPHRMMVTNETDYQEEWTISSFKVNPPLKPDRFGKKK